MRSPPLPTRKNATSIRFTMSQDAEADGAWATVFNRLEGFTVQVTRSDETYVIGQIKETDDWDLTLGPIFDEKAAAAIDGGDPWRDIEVTIPWDLIQEVEYS